MVKKLLAFVAIIATLVPAVAAAQSPSAKSSSAKATAAAKLAETKLKVCQNKEASISKRSSQLTKLATTMTTKFAAIAERVKTYYTDKVVPSGKTVSNYDALVAEITSKKTAVNTAVAAAQSTASSFSCDSDDPKGQLTEFRTEMQAVKKALQDYRTAIKNLIVAVRTVSANSSPKASTSPKATTSPSASPSTSPTAEVE